MKQIIFIFLLLIGLSAFSQQFSVGIRGGLGTYSMNQLDQFQKYRTTQMQLPLQITESYPITPFYRIELALNSIKYLGKLSLFYGYYSTGARSTVSDYSGRVDLDAVINGNQLGLTLQKNFFQNGSISLGAYSDGSYLFSKLNTTDNLEIIYPEVFTERQDYHFVSKGFALEPGLVVSYHLQSLIFQVNLGYMVDFSKKLQLKENSDMILAIGNKQVSPQWSGVRLGIQVSYVFKRINE